MRKLAVWIGGGEDVDTVAAQLGRSVAACERVYRDVRRVRLLDKGQDSGTLLTLRQKTKAVSTGAYYGRGNSRAVVGVEHDA